MGVHFQAIARSALYSDRPMLFLFWVLYGILVEILIRTAKRVLHWRAWVAAILRRDRLDLRKIDADPPESGREAWESLPLNSRELAASSPKSFTAPSPSPHG